MVVKISIYLNRRVFVMKGHSPALIHKIKQAHKFLHSFVIQSAERIELFKRSNGLVQILD